MSDLPFANGRFLSVTEAARFLGISRGTFKTRVDAGKIPFVWRGPHRFFSIERLRYLKSAEDGAKKTQGERDASAVKLIEAGAPDAEVIAVLELPLERVRELRAVVEGTPPAPPEAPPAAPGFTSEAYFAHQASLQRELTMRREEIRARRGQSGPEMPPSSPRSSPATKPSKRRS